jgi:hypothetical protein
MWDDRASSHRIEADQEARGYERDSVLLDEEDPHAVRKAELGRKLDVPRCTRERRWNVIAAFSAIAETDDRNRWGAVGKHGGTDRRYRARACRARRKGG